MNKPREDDIRIATEAARWQRALESGDPSVCAEFADWVKASPRHLREFMFMEALEAAARQLDPERTIAIDQKLQDADNKVVALPTPSSTTVAAPAAHRARRWLAATAAAVVLAVALVGWLAPDLLGGWHRYSTAIGEQRTVELRDGSLLQLNTNSRALVRFDGATREVRLSAGEALFKVAHDTSRPFRVHVGDAVIRAVGTQFNINRHSTGTTVTVLEGKVEISSDAAAVTAAANSTQGQDQPPGHTDFLSAGEVARIDGPASISVSSVADPTESVAWRQRRLMFREESLATIAEEFNRYNRSPQIVVEGESLRNRRYGGTFDADDPDSFVEFVARTGAIELLRGDGQIVIRAQPARDDP